MKRIALPSLLALTLLGLGACADETGYDDALDSSKADRPACGDTGCRSLSSLDRLRVMAERTNRRWGDQNISTGSVIIGAARFKADDPLNDDELNAATEIMLQDLYEQDKFETFPDVEVDLADVTEVFMDDPFEPSIEEVARRAALDGFSFSPSNEVDQAGIFWGARHTLDWLGDEAELMMAESSAEIETTAGEPRQVTASVFYNSETQKYVYIYVREGRF